MPAPFRGRLAVVAVYGLCLIIIPHQCFAINSSYGQCKTSGWRGEAISNAYFKPESVEYYKGPVLKASWPPVIGLALALAALLIYFTWRVCRCCFGWCCCCGRSQTHAERIMAARCLSVLKLMNFLLLLGTAAGCAYGMTQVNPRLVQQGVETLHSVKGYVSGVLQAANSTLVHMQALDGVVVEIQGVIQSDVNATDIVASLHGLKDWMEALPNPTTLKSDIIAARSSIDDVITQELIALENSLNGLLTKLPAGPSSYSSALDTIISAEAFLTQVTGQAEAFNTAAGVLPNPYDGTAPAKMLDVQDALDTFVGDIDAKIASLAAIQASLETLETALLTDQFVQKSYNSLSAIQTTATTLLNGAIPAITTTLRSLQSTYTTAAPYMLRLLDRVHTINSTVMVLPVGLQSQVGLLREAKVTLDVLMQGASPPASLADELDGAASGFALPASVDTALTQLESARDMLMSVNPSGLSQDTADAHSQLQGTRADLESLKLAVDTAVGGGIPPFSYPAILGLITTAAGELMTAISPAASILADPVLFDQAAMAKVQVDTLAGPSLPDLQAQLTTISMLRSAILAVPAVAPYTVMLDSIVPTYNALPQPPAQLLLDAESSVGEIVGDITQELDSARNTISSGVGNAQDQLADIQLQSVGKIDEYEAEYLPMVQTYDKWRQVAIFALLGVGMLLVMLLWVASFLNWPAPLKALTTLVLVALILSWLLVVVFTAVLKVGNDGCANVEAQVIMRIEDSSMRNKQKILAVARYYVYGEGGSVEEVLNTAFGVDVAGVMRDINSTRTELVQQVQEKYQLQNLLVVKLDSAVDISYDIQTAIYGVLDLLSFASVSTVYGEAKHYGCCTVLNAVGGVWVGLVIMGSCALLMCILALKAIRTMDKLPYRGCCARYKESDFTRGGELAFPELPALPEKQGMRPHSKQQFPISADASGPSGHTYSGSSPLRSTYGGYSDLSSPSRQGSGSCIPADRSPNSVSTSPSRLDVRRELLSPSKGSPKDRYCQ